MHTEWTDTTNTIRAAMEAVERDIDRIDDEVDGDDRRVMVRRMREVRDQLRGALQNAERVHKNVNNGHRIER